ncbi:cation transporter [Vibrio kyushuensis]|uniref:cation transporter n=1 Tax=Vibrio kyushuensis TaxID=2910249 RepID=UPI003D0991EE
MNNNIAAIEKRALLIGVIANLIMAISGWVAFNLSGSEALLLDGNMSFILFITAIVALKIAKIKSMKSDAFPFGLYVTEALYTFMKGLLLLGVVISAIVTNSSKVLSYLQGNEIALIKTGIIAYYAIAMVIICGGLALFYRSQNKKINNTSSMLKVDQKASFIDGVLSASTGAILIAIGFIDPAGAIGFLLYIGDSLLVIILATLMVGQPIKIIKEAFVELAGGTLRDEHGYKDIKEKVHVYLDVEEQKISSLHISKTGSSYLVVVGMDHSRLSDTAAKSLLERKQTLTKELQISYPIIDIEMVIA